MNFKGLFDLSNWFRNGVISSFNFLPAQGHLLPGRNFTATAIGRVQTDLLTMAILLGGNVRVGLEDSLLYPYRIKSPLLMKCWCEE